MAARKRPLMSSVEGKIQQAAALRGAAHQPVRDLSPEERVIFDRIVRSRETASWTENDLQNATVLAESMALCDDYTRRLKASGPLSINASGSTVANPLLTARDNAFRSVMQLNRILGLSASQKGVSGPGQQKRNLADAAARDALLNAAEDSLI